jgi:hypothetical protein
VIFSLPTPGPTVTLLRNVTLHQRERGAVLDTNPLRAIPGQRGMKLKLASIRSTQRMHYGGEGVMTPPRAPHPRHVRYSARWQARFDGETRAKIEELACIFHRKRGPVLRYVIQWRLTQTR